MYYAYWRPIFFSELRSPIWTRTAEKGALHFEIHSSEGIVTPKKKLINILLNMDNAPGETLGL